MILSPLYHWSPSENRASILAAGLVPASSPVVATVAQPCVSLSPSPQLGWALSGAMDWVDNYETWDLWLVHLADSDAVTVRSEFGPQVHEVKVGNSIPPSRMWFVGIRDAQSPYINPLPSGDQA